MLNILKMSSMSYINLEFLNDKDKLIDTLIKSNDDPKM